MSFETRQETLKNVLTCGICGMLSREVTIIEECCHTFCRKCIIKKLSRKNLRKCPECNADLGGAPLQKIKTDYKWQSMRDNFNGIRQQLIEHGLMKPRTKNRRASNKAKNDQAEPHHDKKEKGKELEALDQAPHEQVPQVLERESKNLELLVEAVELVSRDIKGKGKLVVEPFNNEAVEPAILPCSGNDPLPATARRKERSISSLVNANGESNQTVHAAAPRAPRGRRRSIVRKNVLAGRATLSSTVEPILIDDDHFGSSNNPNPSAFESSKEQMRDINIRGDEPLEGLNDLLKPLNDLAEAATKLINPTNSELVVVVSSDEVVKEREPNGEGQTSVAPVIPRKPRRGRPRKDEKKLLLLPPPDHNDHDPSNNICPTEKRMLAEDLNIPTLVVVDPATVYRRTRPIWFKLVASNNQFFRESCGPLPSLPPFYIQVKDVHMPASSIKKYLVLKLGLGSEDELDISMRGMPVHPDMQLHELTEWWVNAAKRSEWKKMAAVGSSAQDFVMVLTYSQSFRADHYFRLGGGGGVCPNIFTSISDD